MRKFFVVMFLFVFIDKSFSQSIENVEFEIVDYNVQIKFDLVNCPENTLYNLTVFLKKEYGENISPKTITGANGVRPGRSNVIIWDYKADKVDFTGNLSAYVTIVSSYDIPPPPRIKHGPGNAFLSVLLPGMGDLAVNKTDKVTPFLISALYLGSAYMAYNSITSANTSYESYLKATTQTSMDEHFNAATSGMQQGKVFLGAAAAIWLIDVIHVIVKGSRNIKDNQTVQNRTKLKPQISISKNGMPIYQFALVKTF